jgi:hypothetical protein
MYDALLGARPIRQRQRVLATARWECLSKASTGVRFGYENKFDNLGVPLEIPYGESNKFVVDGSDFGPMSGVPTTFALDPRASLAYRVPQPSQDFPAPQVRCRPERCCSSRKAIQRRQTRRTSAASARRSTASRPPVAAVPR